MDTFAKRFRYLRETILDITQDQMADKLGVSRPTIAGYESEEKNRIPREETLKKIADTFDVRIDWLFGRSEEIKNSVGVRNEKDEHDIAKRMEQIKKDLSNEDGLSFHGEPMSEEAIESLMEAMEHVVRQTQRINKKYIPKKFRKDENNN